MNKPYRTALVPFAAASLLAFAGLATAQNAPTAKAGTVQTKTESVSVQTTTLSDGKNTVEVRVVDGQVFVKVNGEQRATRKLNDDWAKFEIRSNEDEKVIATVLKNGNANGVMVLSGTPTEDAIAEYRVRLAEVEPRKREWVHGYESLAELKDLEKLKELELYFAEGFEGMVDFEFDEEAMTDILRNFEISIAGEENPMAQLRFDPAEQPKSMIGITMNIETTEDGQRIIIEDVMEGLPAANAGLRAGDRIVEIESIGKADEKGIRRITREFEPGEEVTLRIVRDGEEVEKVITLAPYRNNVFGQFEQQAGASGQRFFTIERDAQRMAELNAQAERLQAEIAERRAQIERIAEQMTQTAKPEELAAQLRDAALKLEESVRRLSEQRARQSVERGMLERLSSKDGGGVIIGRAEPGERPYVLTIPAPAVVPGVPAVPPAPSRVVPGIERQAPNPQTQQRIDSLEERLNRLEESNQRIERMLEALMAQVAPRS